MAMPVVQPLAIVPWLESIVVVPLPVQFQTGADANVAAHVAGSTLTFGGSVQAAAVPSGEASGASIGPASASGAPLSAVGPVPPSPPAAGAPGWNPHPASSSSTYQRTPHLTGRGRRAARWDALAPRRQSELGGGSVIRTVGFPPGAARSRRYVISV